MQVDNIKVPVGLLWVEFESYGLREIVGTWPRTVVLQGIEPSGQTTEIVGRLN